MFQVRSPVIIIPTGEARVALAAQLRPAALAAWREIARRGQGIEIGHFQIVHAGVTLAICTRLRQDGFIIIELGLGDPRQAARFIPESAFRRAETRLHASRRSGSRR